MTDLNRKLVFLVIVFITAMLFWPRKDLVHQPEIVKELRNAYSFEEKVHIFQKYSYKESMKYYDEYNRAAIYYAFKDSDENITKLELKVLESINNIIVYQEAAIKQERERNLIPKPLEASITFKGKRWHHGNSKMSWVEAEMNGNPILLAESVNMFAKGVFYKGFNASAYEIGKPYTLWVHKNSYSISDNELTGRGTGVDFTRPREWNVYSVTPYGSEKFKNIMSLHEKSLILPLEVQVKIEANEKLIAQFKEARSYSIEEQLSILNRENDFITL